jgi:hypothetical protein
MAESVTLQYPIEFGEEVISELNFEPPTLGDLKKLDKIKGEMEKAIKVISICTGLDPVQVEMIKTPDMEAVTEIVEKFMPNERKTGET